MPKSAIFIDIDGCIMPTDGNVSKEHFDSLTWLTDYIRKANIGIRPNIKLCTGRNVPFTDAIFYSMGRPDSTWSIAEDGCVFFNPLTREMRINPAISEETQAILTEIRRRIVPKLIKKYPELWLYPGNIVNITLSRRFNEQNQAGLRAAKKTTLRMIAGLFRIKRIVAKIFRRKKTIPNPIKGKIVKVVVVSNSISIMPAGINKGVAIKILAKEEDIDLKHSLGIGDAKSDLSFLREVGFAGCPSNASEYCKELVRAKRGCISFFPCAKGVVDVIQHFLPN